jgi:hypothetical protein
MVQCRSSSSDRPALRSTHTPIQFLLGCFPRGKAITYKVDHAPSFCARFKNGRRCPYVFVMWCLTNPLAPSDPYMGRTAQLTSRRCILTLCSRVVNLIKYPLMPGRFNFFDVQLQNVLLLTFWLCGLVSYTCRQTHSQNGASENDESRDRGSNRVTEKTTLVVARLQSVKYLFNKYPYWIF